MTSERIHAFEKVRPGCGKARSRRGKVPQTSSASLAANPSHKPPPQYIAVWKQVLTNNGLVHVVFIQMLMVAIVISSFIMLVILIMIVIFHVIISFIIAVWKQALTTSPIAVNMCSTCYHHANLSLTG